MVGTLYRPPRYLRNGHVNSIVSSSAVRRLRLSQQCRQLVNKADSKVLQLNDGVQLQAYFNLHDHVTNNNAESIVVFLHGWEGCANSLYVLDLASFLFDQGYDVARLNFRDHGNTHQLNTELFHSCRLDEVRDAITAIQQQRHKSSVILIGFSLGGNFALRVTAAPHAIQLHKTFSICPVVDPKHTLSAIESAFPVYRYYFLHRWKDSLKTKARHFPQHYRYQDIKPINSLSKMTQMLVERHTAFTSLEDYLQGYSVSNNRLDSIASTTYLLFARDDPIIPVSDTKKLQRNDHIHLQITDYGGHVGYLDRGMKFNWLNQYILQRLRPEGHDYLD